MLTFLASEAPAEYRFIDPNTGFKYSAPTKQALLTQIIAYRDQNRLPRIEHLSTIIDNYLCSLPQNSGKCTTLKLQRNFMQYLQGGVTLLMNVFYKKQVSDIEAEDRAKQCVKCPHNVFPDRSAFVQWSDDIAERSTGGRKTSQHDSLGNCEVCSCTLKAKVFYGGDIKLSDIEAEKMKKVNCWQLKVRE